MTPLDGGLLGFALGLVAGVLVASWLHSRHLDRMIENLRRDWRKVETR